MRKNNPIYLLFSFVSGFLLVALVMRLLTEDGVFGFPEDRAEPKKNKKMASRKFRKTQANSSAKPISKPKQSSKRSSSTEKEARIKKIVQLLKQKKEVGISEIHSKLSNVSVRTLRRDMDLLEKQKLVKKVGKGRATVYQYRGA